jgi:hypothetical protein
VLQRLIKWKGLCCTFLELILLTALQYWVSIAISAHNHFDVVFALMDNDIKPYVPQYDSVLDSSAPSWTYDPPVAELKRVVFDQVSEESLKSLVGFCKLYHQYEDIKSAIEQVLILDIRSVRKRKKDRIRDHHDEEKEEMKEDEGPERHRFAIDVLNVVFTVVNEVVNVVCVELDTKLPPGWEIKR